MSGLEQNLEKLNGLLARFRKDGIKNRIAGEDRDGVRRQVSHHVSGRQKRDL